MFPFGVVDDILVMCRNLEETARFGNEFAKAFEIMELCKINRCLVMKFEKIQDGISIGQKSNIAKILKRFRMLDCNMVSTPLEAGAKLSKGVAGSDSDGVRPPYPELVKCLSYLAVATLPDITHAASLLSQFNNCFSKDHWNAAKRVLKYLEGTWDIKICSRRCISQLDGYVDAD